MAKNPFKEPTLEELRFHYYAAHPRAFRPGTDVEKELKKLRDAAIAAKKAAQKSDKQ